MSISGGVIYGDLNISNHKIINLGTLVKYFDAATKKYVDDISNPVVTTITTINSGMIIFRDDFTNHVQTFLNFRRNLNKSINEFFGSPPTVDIKLVDINTKLNDIISGIPDIIEKKRILLKFLTNRSSTSYTSLDQAQLHGHNKIKPSNTPRRSLVYTGCLCLAV